MRHKELRDLVAGAPVEAAEVTVPEQPGDARVHQVAFRHILPGLLQRIDARQIDTPQRQGGRIHGPDRGSHKQVGLDACFEQGPQRADLQGAPCASSGEHES